MQGKSKDRKKCPGYRKECDAMIGANSELCTRCYARRHYYTHNGAKAKKTTRKKAAANGNGNATPHTPGAEGLDSASLRQWLGAQKLDLQRKLEALTTIEQMLG